MSTGLRSLEEVRIKLKQDAETAVRMRWKSTEPVEQGEVGKDLPRGWVAARINDTGLYINGLAFKPADWKNTGIPIIRIQNLTDTTKEFNYASGSYPDEVIVRNGDILVSWSATLDAFLWNRGEGVLNQHIFRTIPAEGLTHKAFLLILLRNAIREMGESEHAHGLVMTHINRGPFLNHIVLIPPLIEQQRIVDKFNELMSLCDQLELARIDREAARDTFALSTVSRLNTPDPETFAADVRFALANLTPLTTRADQIKHLRETILNLAVRGMLVKQSPSEEPAGELIKKISQAKHKLLATKKLKSNTPITNSISIRTETNLPDNWQWSSCNELFFITKLAGFEYTKYFDLKDYGDVPVIRAQNVRPWNIEEKNLKYLPIKSSKILERSSVTKPCLLITFIGAGIGDVALINPNRRWHLAPNVAKAELFEGCDSLMNLKYLVLFFNSPVGRAEIFKHVKTTAQPSLSMGTLRDIDVAVPPLAEQSRIVAKVGELMALCDQLEASITKGEQSRSRLLEAVLHNALEPA
ncbi:restriction endonuclease subunit S [Sphingobium sp. AS12]|uniref:restriction endonuclease subunit S n=1 Tax=Sphingobium sp. AS12 TaxID=2849495 RepID=UPI001C318AFA|nr:restriction endonuclease subunit S [Sphingobium sp. AS12]MBV2150906.1 restriction endonuclease subunit S [Sphingobium sp. AS12]